MLLAILDAGARGATAAEIRRVARFTLTEDRLHDAFQRLSQPIRDGPIGSSPGLRLGAAVWAHSSVQVNPAFAAIVQSRYDAAVREVDFVDALPAAIGAINQWAEEKTLGKIRQLVTPVSVTSETRLVLTTAVYFREKWQYRFKAADTRTAQFVAPGRPTEVRMMSQLGTFRYSESDSFQAILLPYAGRRFEMIVYLPRPGHRASSSLAGLVNATAALEEKRVRVELPVFSVAAELSLGNTLERFGMQTAFSAAADFSGMTTTRGLSLSTVLQKAVVEVSEEGTEAAAATAGAIGITSAEEPVVFRADRPFLFIIRDSSLGVILFAGGVIDPSLPPSAR